LLLESVHESGSLHYAEDVLGADPATVRNIDGASTLVFYGLSGHDNQGGILQNDLVGCIVVRRPSQLDFELTHHGRSSILIQRGVVGSTRVALPTDVSYPDPAHALSPHTPNLVGDGRGPPSQL
jgi:hypothetical protein